MKCIQTALAASSIGIMLIANLPAWSEHEQRSDSRQPVQSSQNIQTAELTANQREARNLIKAAVTDYKAHNWHAADEKLQRAKTLDPQRVFIYKAHAFVLQSMGRLTEAMYAIDIALAMSPNDPDVQLRKAAITLNQGDRTSALIAYQSFLRDFPNHKQTQYINDRIKNLQKDLAQEKSVARAGRHSDTDYFGFAIQRYGVTRWDEARMPLKIYTPPETVACCVKDYTAVHTEALKAAASEWQTKTDGAVTFTYTDSPENADIIIEWIDDQTKLRDTARSGETNYRWNGDGSFSRSTIMMMANAAGRNKNQARAFERIRNLALHEIGHAIGLIGHSPSPGDIMYGSGRAQDAMHDLSSRDIKTVRLLYQAKIQRSAKKFSNLQR